MALIARVTGRARVLAGKATGNRRLQRRGKRQLRRARREAKRHKRMAKAAALGGTLALARRKRPMRRGKKDEAGGRSPEGALLVRRTVTTVDTYVPAEPEARKGRRGHKA